MKRLTHSALSTLCIAFFLNPSLGLLGQTGGTQPLRVFIFAGQSNMVGSDSQVSAISEFPPFVGVETPRPDVRFAYCLGRENKTRSDGWEALAPVNGLVGPELTFAREVTQVLQAPIAVIKCAAGGTHLGGDWNPRNPSRFKMYPLTLDLIRARLAELEAEGIDYRLEGFIWHQGENDMFEEGYLQDYGTNLKQFIAAWRKDLNTPKLPFYIGELCTKTIWGMDLRLRMNAIRQGQEAVTETDPLATYVPTSHIGVEIGEPVGLHYHYGTLGQLEHGVNYAQAYLKAHGVVPAPSRALQPWPHVSSSRVRLFILAGHRNMQGEHAFVQQVDASQRDLLQPKQDVPYRYSIGGGYNVSKGWEAMRPAGFYQTFGPELSFAQHLASHLKSPIAIAKYTHGGSQLNDWTPEGTPATKRHLYPDFIRFIQESITDLIRRGHSVELVGVFYHLGENEMSMPPYRRQVSSWLQSLIRQTRIDLNLPDLHWYVSQQRPTDHQSVNSIDVTAALRRQAETDPHLTRIDAFHLNQPGKKLVFNTQGVIALGYLLAESYLQARP